MHRVFFGRDVFVPAHWEHHQIDALGTITIVIIAALAVIALGVVMRGRS